MADTKDKVMIGAGLAALAAGIYFYKTEAGKKHAKELKGWMVKMKGEVIEKLEEVGEVTQPIYDGIVDKAAKLQLAAGSVPKSEVVALAEDLKKNWNTISRMVRAAKSAPKKRSSSRSSAPKRRRAKKASK